MGARLVHQGIIVGAVLGTTVPIAILLMTLLLVVCVLLARGKRVHNEWELDPSELEVDAQLGAGGYGVVYRAKWRGTEVAVKTITEKAITKEMERAFKEEVHLRNFFVKKTRGPLCNHPTTSGAGYDNPAPS